jgi:hypothetical protein
VSTKEFIQSSSVITFEDKGWEEAGVAVSMCTEKKHVNFNKNDHFPIIQQI